MAKYFSHVLNLIKIGPWVCTVENYTHNRFPKTTFSGLGNLKRDIDSRSSTSNFCFDQLLLMELMILEIISFKHFQ